MKILILLIIAGAAIFVGPYLSDEQGFVHIAAGEYVIETSLTTAIILLFVAFIVFYLVLRALLNIKATPKVFGVFLNKRAQKKALNQTRQALIWYEEGAYEKALAAIKKLHRKGKATLDALFVGARSACELGQYDLTRSYLDEAQKLSKHSYLSASLIRAELNLKIGNAQAALEILDELKSSGHRGKLIAALTYECYKKQNDYQALKKLSPSLVRYNLMTKQEADAINESSIGDSLSSYGSIEQLQGLYKSLSRAEKQNSAICGPIMDKMIALGAIPQAKKICLDLLKHRQDPEILERISRWEISVPEVLKALNNLESRNLIASQVNVPLLKAIGNLQLHEGQLKEAQEHYAKALELVKSPDIYLKLASILSAQRLYDKAASCYEKALKLYPKALPSSAGSKKAA